MMKSVPFKSLLLTVFFLAAPATAYAGMDRDLGLIMRGVGKTVGSVFQVPFGMLSGSTQFFPFGMVAGAVGGTFKAVGGTLSGAWDIARGSAPYAKYLIFL